MPRTREIDPRVVAEACGCWALAERSCPSSWRCTALHPLVVLSSRPEEATRRMPVWCLSTSASQWKEPQDRINVRHDELWVV